MICYKDFLRFPLGLRRICFVFLKTSNFNWCSFFFIPTAKGEGGEAPRFVLPLSPIRASDGEPTKLICTLTGKPIPQITWYCGQREIRPSRDFQPAFEPTTGAASLTIAEVFPDDEGIYRCRATNTHGTAECEAALTVGKLILSRKIRTKEWNI